MSFCPKSTLALLWTVLLIAHSIHAAENNGSAPKSSASVNCSSLISGTPLSSILSAFRQPFEKTYVPTPREIARIEKLVEHKLVQWSTRPIEDGDLQDLARSFGQKLIALRLTPSLVAELFAAVESTRPPSDSFFSDLFGTYLEEIQNQNSRLSGEPLVRFFKGLFSIYGRLNQNIRLRHLVSLLVRLENKTSSDEAVVLFFRYSSTFQNWKLNSTTSLPTLTNYFALGLPLIRLTNCLDRAIAKFSTPEDALDVVFNFLSGDGYINPQKRLSLLEKVLQHTSWSDVKIRQVLQTVERYGIPNDFVSRFASRTNPWQSLGIRGIFSTPDEVIFTTGEPKAQWNQTGNNPLSEGYILEDVDGSDRFVFRNPQGQLVISERLNHRLWLARAVRLANNPEWTEIYNLFSKSDRVPMSFEDATYWVGKAARSIFPFELATLLDFQPSNHDGSSFQVGWSLVLGEQGVVGNPEVIESPIQGINPDHNHPSINFQPSHTSRDRDYGGDYSAFVSDVRLVERILKRADNPHLEIPGFRTSEGLYTFLVHSAAGTTAVFLQVQADGGIEINIAYTHFSFEPKSLIEWEMRRNFEYAATHYVKSFQGVVLGKVEWVRPEQLGLLTQRVVVSPHLDTRLRQLGASMFESPQLKTIDPGDIWGQQEYVMSN